LAGWDLVAVTMFLVTHLLYLAGFHDLAHSFFFLVMIPLTIPISFKLISFT